MKGGPVQGGGGDPSLWRRATGALVAVAIAAFVTWAMRPWLLESKFLWLHVATAVSAWYGGLPAGLLAVVLSMVAIELPPLRGPGGAGLRAVHLLLFGLAAAAIAWAVGSLRAARREADARHAEAAELSERLQEQAIELEQQVEQTASLAEELEQQVDEAAALNERLEQANEQLRSAARDRAVLLEAERRARDEAEDSQRRLAIVAEASAVLASSLDMERTLGVTARLALRDFADWCIVDLGAGAAARRVEAAATDPRHEALLRELHQRFPERLRSPDNPLTRAAATGEAQLVEAITDAMLERQAVDAEHLRMLRELEPGSLVAAPLLSHGETHGTLTFVRRRSAAPYDEADRQLAAELGRRAAAALENARLYAESEEANRAKADFLAIMSHELRTPLTAILGYTDLLDSGVSGPVTEKQRTQLGRVRASAWHLLALIEEILTYARVEVGRDTVQLETVRLQDAAREAAVLLEPQAAAKSLDLRIEVTDGLIRSDPGKLRQMLVNLLGNAIKFTAEGGVAMTGGCADGWCTIEVADTGIGIAAADLERIFEPFTQLEDAMTRRAGGTGLGLAVTRRLAELLGGDISVASEPGRGSRFRLRLPVDGPDAA